MQIGRPNFSGFGIRKKTGTRAIASGYSRDLIPSDGSIRTGGHRKHDSGAQNEADKCALKVNLCFHDILLWEWLN